MKEDQYISLLSSFINLSSCFSFIPHPFENLIIYRVTLLKFISWYIYIIRSRSPMKINGFNNEHDSQLQLISLFTNCTKELFSFCFLFSCLSLFFIRVEILVQNRRIIWLKNRTKQLSSWTALHILLYFD